MKKGKLIVLAGLDGSGKFTQSKELMTRLAKQGFETASFDFPQYDKPFGALVGKYLRGEYGTIEEVPVEVVAMLFALDRYSIRDEIQEAKDEGKIVVLNRYTSANVGFQGAKFDGKERKEFIEWLDWLESRLPQPDLVVFLDVPRKFTRFLMGNKDLREYLGGEKEDIHEKDDPYQIKVEQNYRDLAKARSNWVRIDCIKDNEVMSIEAIHEKVWMVVKKIL